MSDRENFDILLELQRIRGGSRMIAEGTDPAKLTEELCAEIRHQIELFCSQRKISRDKLGRSIGLSAATVSEVLKGTYKADCRAILIQMDQWLEQEIRRLDAPTTTQFVWTSVAREIETVARLASQLKTIGLVYGPDTSGIGKTTALQAIHAETPGSIFITIEKAHANPTGVLRSISRAMRLADGAKNASLYERIKGLLRDTPRLLIVDQIHNLRFSKDDKPLYYLTDLYDNTNHAPQLWCGTADMVAYLNRGSKRADESLAQVRRRIGIVRDLMQRTKSKTEGGHDEPLYTIEQIREAFGKNKVRITADGIRMLWQLACLPDSGALGTCKNVVRIATIVAEHSGRSSIDASTLWAALRDCVQSTVFTDIRAQFEDDAPVRRAAVG